MSRLKMPVEGLSNRYQTREVEVLLVGNYLPDDVDVIMETSG